MRLATFNLLHGRSTDDGRVVPARLTEAMRRLDADVLGLQEVDRDQPRSDGHDLAGLAAAALGAREWRFAPALIGTPGVAWHAVSDEAGVPPAGTPAYGVALISRLPVRAWRVLRFAAAPTRSPVLLPGSRRPVLLEDEPRVALAAVVEAPFGPMTVVTAHLSFVPGWNAVQLRRLVRGMADLPRPLVLLGDLNLPGALPRRLTGWRPLVTAPTYPADRPRVQLDHILADGVLPELRAEGAPRLGLSDHRALTVELSSRSGMRP